MGFFTRRPEAPRSPEIWESNPHFNGQPFNMAVQMCDTIEQLNALIAGYTMSTSEMDRYDERFQELEAAEQLQQFAERKYAELDGKFRAMGGLSESEIRDITAKQTQDAVESEIAVTEIVNAAISAFDRKMNREDRQANAIATGFAEVRSAIADADHIGQAFGLASRHPFLAGFLGAGVINRLKS